MRCKYSMFPGILPLLCIFIVTGCSSSPSATAPSATGTPPTSTQVVAHPVATTGCGKTSIVPPGSSQIRVLFSNRITRSYLLHVPSGYKNTVQQPLVLNFHGHASIAQQQEEVTGFSTLADQNDFIVAYPEGVVGPDRHSGWATGPARDPHVNDVLFVSDLLNELQSMLCINPMRIYATGFSNGGGMTNLLACTMADRIAAFAPVSGSYPPVPGGCNPTRPVPILEFHGTGDQTVPYSGSAAKNYPPVMQWLQGWVQRDGCATTPMITSPVVNVTEYQWTDCHNGSIVIHYRLAGWPHAWPNITRAIPVRRGQHPGSTSTPTSPPSHPSRTITAPIDATSIIWSFFVAHPLPRGANG